MVANLGNTTKSSVFSIPRISTIWDQTSWTVLREPELKISMSIETHAKCEENQMLPATLIHGAGRVCN